MLHALNGLRQPVPVQSEFPNDDDTIEDSSPSVPCTSLPCKWVVPKTRKESTQEISSAIFTKHDRDKPVKRPVKLLEDFDPRPAEYRGKAKSYVPGLLKKVKYDHLGISVLLDADYNDEVLQPSSYSLPNVNALKDTVKALKDSLQVSCDEARKIEAATREQRLSSSWFEVRRYRLTASRFGEVISRRADTPPQRLVLNILKPTDFTYEKVALEAYIKKQHKCGHPDLVVSQSGFLINPSWPSLGASPDGAVYDPSNADKPFGFVEIKCPFSVRHLTPAEATHTPGFCSITDDSGNIVLKEKHSYYGQIQGQMALGERPWCDFVIYTQTDITIQRIDFNEQYWEENLPKLLSFYDNCIAPEIVSPCHTIELPVRKL